MPARGGFTQYVRCPYCSDPVAGHLPSPREEQKLTCARCQRTFPFDKHELRSGIVLYDEEANRWKVA